MKPVLLKPGPSKAPRRKAVLLYLSVVLSSTPTISSLPFCFKVIPAHPSVILYRESDLFSSSFQPCSDHASKRRANRHRHQRGPRRNFNHRGTARGYTSQPRGRGRRGGQGKTTGEKETSETEERRGRLHIEGSAIRRANTLPARGAAGQSQPLQSVGLRDHETRSLADYPFPLSLCAEG